MISNLLCPSDDTDGKFSGGQNTSSGMRACTSYGGNLGAQNFSVCGTGWNTVNTNGSQTHGDSLDANLISGVLGHYPWSAKIRDVVDGTSNTIALGEVRPKCSTHLQNGWMHMNSLWIGTTGGINAPTCPGEPGYGTGCNTTTSWGTAQAFKSRHAGERPCHPMRRLRAVPGAGDQLRHPADARRPAGRQAAGRVLCALFRRAAIGSRRAVEIATAPPSFIADGRHGPTSLTAPSERFERCMAHRRALRAAARRLSRPDTTPDHPLP